MRTVTMRTKTLSTEACVTDPLRTGDMHIDDDANEPTEPVDADQLDTLPPPTEPLGGAPLGSRYVIENEIGSGATGRVWRGRRRDDGSPIAVKVLRPEFTRNPEAVARFVRQRTALLELDHPHLVKIHDLVAEGEVLAVVMDLVDGEDLRQLAGRRALRPSQALTVLEQVAAALVAVHAAGVVHRDVKPENVLVRWQDRQPHALLTDFGIAGAASGPTDLTRLSQLLGTPAYVAPEIVKGQPAVPASDVYALGIMAYELLTGERPYHATNTAALLHAHVTEEPHRPRQLAEPTWALLRAMLAKAPTARPIAAMVATEFGRLRTAGLLPPPVPPPPPPAGLPPPPAAMQADPMPSPAPPEPIESVSSDGASANLSSAEPAIALPTTDATRPAPAPPSPPAPRQRRGWLVTAIGSMAVLGAGLGIYLGQNEAATPPLAPPEGPQPWNYYVDTHVTSPEPGLAVLEWDEGVESIEGFGLYTIRRGDGSRSTVFDPGPEIDQPYQIAELDQDTEYCWFVVAVVFSHDPPDPPYASLSNDKVACVTPNGEPETP